MRRAATTRGVALLEVMVAMGVLAVSGLGIVAAQLAIARGAHQAAWRAQAWRAADAHAEMARAGDEEAARESPGSWVEARVEFSHAGPGVRVVTLRRERGAAQPCDGAARECVALAFAPGGATR